MIDLIIISSLSAAVVILAVALIYSTLSKRNLKSQLIQTALDSMRISSELDRVNNQKGLNENDEFVKFLSDSRDWAFDYIETVQKSIMDLHIAMGLSDEVMIAAAYKSLLDHLPKDGVNN
jgi:hypothetical protein